MTFWIDRPEEVTGFLGCARLKVFQSNGGKLVGHACELRGLLGES